MAGEDMPAGPTDPIFNRLLKDRIISSRPGVSLIPKARE